MRLKGYLITEGRTKKISEKQFIKEVKTKCSQIVDVCRDTDRYYYRGIYTDFRSEFGFVQPSKFNRQSAWAEHNTYTLLLDNLPSWRKYPKRSKSVIMTTDRSNAQGRGGNNIPYIVFPVNGSKIGICRSRDIWDSFPDLFYEWGVSHMEEFNRRLALIADWLANENYDFDMDKWSDIKRLLDIKPNDSDNRDAVGYLQDNYDIDIHKTIGEQLIPLLDPKRNDFQLFTTKTIPPGQSKETWTDGDCYLIDAFEWERRIKDKL